MSYQLIPVTAADGSVVQQEWLQKAESVHRQLRPHLADNYSAQMRRVFEGGGRMLLATESEDVVGVAVYRLHENTFDGLHCYIDDLVTDEKKRSYGTGKALLDSVELIARNAGCQRIKLDSGTQRGRAHKFYFREGMQIASFHFFKDLD